MVQLLKNTFELFLLICTQITDKELRKGPLSCLVNTNPWFFFFFSRNQQGSKLLNPMTVEISEVSS